MQPKTVRTCTFLTALLFSYFAPGPGLYAFDLEITDDRLTIRAVNVPLQDVLKRLTDYGIAIRIDPEINPQISATFENRVLEDGIKALLKPQNHVFFWKRTQSRQGGAPAETYRLNEIHVFRPGLKGRMINFDPTGDTAAPAKPEAVALPDTKVSIQENRVLVPVTIGYQGETVETTLIFDTGAGSIVLHDTIAEQLNIQDTQTSTGIGVGGIEIQARTTRLDFVQVGPHKKENLRADIVTYQGAPDAAYNGLLGMNFIRGLKYTIDFNNQVIQWSP
jgi:predicted aspartyl protease